MLFHVYNVGLATRFVLIGVTIIKVSHIPFCRKSSLSKHHKAFDDFACVKQHGFWTPKGLTSVVFYLYQWFNRRGCFWRFPFADDT